MMENFSLLEWIQIAYKKYKSSVYFNRTNPLAREGIVSLESEWQNFPSRKEKIFQEIAAALSSDSLEVWEEYQANILTSLKAVCYPKTLESSKTEHFFTTAKAHTVSVKSLQYMIDMPVEGHLLGVLWIMLYGYQIDSGLYERAYANRIRKTLYNELSQKPTFSPYLFEPYFQQYQSWRDSALEDAKSCLRKDNDVVILTLDLARYYYSVDLTPQVMDQILSEGIIPGEQEEIVHRLGRFIEKVCSAYSSHLPENLRGCRAVLPIGFLPSNILGNWFLSRFDQAITDQWNPLYYGRYVDDILIVDKIESNSDIGKRAAAETLRKEDVIRFFLLQCSKGQGVLDQEPLNCSASSALFQAESEDRSTYFINPRYLPPDCACSIALQDEKVNIFYFQRKESDALLRCFQQNIGQTVSVFQHMPEADAVFFQNDYHEIYSLKQKGVNKLRDVESVEIDKFSLSKFLGKYLLIRNLVNDPAEREFERDLEKIFDLQSTIENYPLWERVAETLTLNERFHALGRFSARVREAIAHLKFPETNDSPSSTELSSLQNTLHRVHASGISKALALCWKPAVEKLSRELVESLRNEPKEIQELYLTSVDSGRRAAWFYSRMANKSLMPILPDLFQIDMTVDKWTDDLNVNLTRFDDALRFFSSGQDQKLSIDHLNNLDAYKYPPYIISMHDLSIARLFAQLLASQMPIAAEDYKAERIIYMKSNYQTYCPENFPGIISTAKQTFGSQIPISCSLVKVGSGKMKKLRIALSNVHMELSSLTDVLDGYPDRSYARYQAVSTLVNQALETKADMVIMPEAFIPFEWLPVLARTCAKNQLAAITGVEHLVIHGIAYNLTAVILPFEENGNRCTQICFHLKNHYAPRELEEIARFHLRAPAVKPQYELYCWNDCWFSVYCCFELCSIQERALFQSYVDFLVAVEWNRDVNHYSSIIKSLARDIHCYCIQANESRYGDSRIIIPAPTEERDLVRTKGGKNPVVLTDEIDIKDLRDFQCTGHSRMKFKSLPPLFDQTIADQRRRHTLWETFYAGGLDLV